LRYLKPKRTFVSVITLISVFGVTLGVSILIIVISVMTGFEREIKEKILGFEPHILVTSEVPLESWPQLIEEFNAMPEVVETTPFVQGQVILEFDSRRRAPQIRAIDPGLGAQLERLESLVPDGYGSFDLNGDNAVIGEALARALGIYVGDKITVYSPENIDDVLEALDQVEQSRQRGEEASDLVANLRQMILPLELEVTGIFDSGRWDFNSEFIFVPLHVGQELYSLGPAVHGLAVQTADPYRAHDTKVAILRSNHQALNAYTWMDMNRQMFSAVDMERKMMFFLLFFIIIVAAFCIMNTMITVTVQKRREIGLMSALGAQKHQIIRIFLFQGFVVGVFGTLSGLASGLLFIRYRNAIIYWLSNTFGLTIFPEDVYLLGALPAVVVPRDVIIICGAAVLTCLLAARLPARFAARLEPAKALRADQ
ncbi:MAG: FtsX-like permease family protein, partial [Verrucomicrobiales bacterium]